MLNRIRCSAFEVRGDEREYVCVCVSVKGAKETNKWVKPVALQ